MRRAPTKHRKIASAGIGKRAEDSDELILITNSCCSSVSGGGGAADLLNTSANLVILHRN